MPKATRRDVGWCPTATDAFTSDGCVSTATTTTRRWARAHRRVSSSIDGLFGAASWPSIRPTGYVGFRHGGCPTWCLPGALSSIGRDSSATAQEGVPPTPARCNVSRTPGTFDDGGRVVSMPNATLIEATPVDPGHRKAISAMGADAATSIFRCSPTSGGAEQDTRWGPVTASPAIIPATNVNFTDRRLVTASGSGRSHYVRGTDSPPPVYGRDVSGRAISAIGTGKAASCPFEVFVTHDPSATRT